MFKKLFCALCALTLVAGCSNSNNTSTTTTNPSSLSQEDLNQQQAVVQEYYAAIQSGDIKTANGFLTDNADDQTKVKELYTTLDGIATKYNLYDSYQYEIDMYLSYVVSYYVQSYEVTSTDQDGVHVKMNAVNVEHITNKLKTYLKDYIFEHKGDIAQAVASGDYTSLGYDLINYIQTQTDLELADLNYEEMNVTFSFERVDGQWKISRIQK